MQKTNLRFYEKICHYLGYFNRIICLQKRRKIRFSRFNASYNIRQIRQYPNYQSSEYDIGNGITFHATFPRKV
ncbi:MAG: hypothetical protein RMJ97_09505 [Raineya sp.]|nr:hypothetical protein [Raineya sp.]